MQMQTKKKVPWFLACGLLALAGLAVLTVSLAGFFGVHSRTYQLNLPAPEALSAVTLVQKDGEERVLADGDVENVLCVLTGSGRTTRTESIQDEPVNVDDWIKVDFNFQSGGASRLFAYQKADKYYLEQPYNGIYQISGDEYNSLEEHIR